MTNTHAEFTIRQLREELDLTIAASNHQHKRAEAAEAERDALRGEIVTLREAMMVAGNIRVDNHIPAHLWSIIVDSRRVLDNALVDAPRAAQLGALVEAAFSLHSYLTGPLTATSPDEEYGYKRRLIEAADKCLVK